MFEESLEEFQWSQGLRDSDLGTKTDPKYVRTKFHEKSLEKQACQVKTNWFLWIILHFAQIRNDHTSILWLGQSQVQPNQLKDLLSQRQGCRKPLVPSPVSHVPLKQFSKKISWRRFDGNAFYCDRQASYKKTTHFGTGFYNIELLQKENKQKQQPHAFSFQS